MVVGFRAKFPNPTAKKKRELRASVILENVLIRYINIKTQNEMRTTLLPLNARFCNTSNGAQGNTAMQKK